MSELAYFKELKKDLLKRFQQKQPHWQKGLADFGVREIRFFQNMLQEETGDRVSEKWFYTHLKKDHNKLPRIDVLELLSKFVGFGTWANFKKFHPLPAIEKEDKKQNTYQSKPTAKRSKIWLFLLTGALAFFTLILALSNLNVKKVKKYKVCFIDGLTLQPLKKQKITIKQFLEKESPITSILENNNCHVFTTQEKNIVFSVEVDYYKTDTIERNLYVKTQNETIPLKRDNYARMIHLFSTGSMEDLQKQRTQLEKIIADEAMIFQIDNNTGLGMELYNKEEFIRKMTLPVLSLKNIKILNAQYNKEGQILKLKFIQE